MVFEVHHHIEDDVLVVELSGDLGSIEENEALLEATRPLMRSVGLPLVLFDFTRVGARLELGDAFFFVRSLPVVERFYRCALLEGPVRPKDFKYYEATARNAGHHIRVFTDKAVALQWLRSGTSASSSRTP